MKKLRLVFVSLFVLVALSCGGGSDDGGGTPPPPPDSGGDDDPMTVADPSAATLIFPEDDTECNEGTVISDLESDVTFQWNASQNTDSYTITLTNLNNGASFDTSANTNEATITIARGTPYEWFVTSRANGTNVTAESSRFRFYNQGPGIENYAPFPAEAINPTRGATLNSSTTTVQLEWSASDVDNDIAGYEVFFGLDDEDMTSLGIITETSFDVTVASGNIYEWRIKVNDEQNNSSTSEIFTFRVE